MSQAFEQARALLRQIPPPPDIVERLEELEQLIDPDEAERFGDLWEAAWAALDAPPVPPHPAE